jgi:hypothetical protein
MNFLVNLRILLVFDPFSFTKKGIKWPSLIEPKHVIVCVIFFLYSAQGVSLGCLAT